MIAAPVIGHVEIKPEALPVERNRAIEISDLEHDRHQTSSCGHGAILPCTESPVDHPGWVVIRAIAIGPRRRR
jgi:hypothetical protein